MFYRQHTRNNTIQYTGLESEIISTPLFNRLHRILQNSLAYLTFPSNKTKRFEHSIGVMHLAGRMFHYSILNARPERLNPFFEEVKEEINKWHANIKRDSYQYIENKRKLKSPNKTPGETISKFQIPENKLYKKSIPVNIYEEYGYLFLVIWQAIRVVGLLHDVGHLPYSHILEKALKSLYNDILGIPIKQRNKKQKEFLKVFKTYFNEKNQSQLNCTNRLVIRYLKLLRRVLGWNCQIIQSTLNITIKH